LRESALRDQIDLRKTEQLQLKHLKSVNADPDADKYLLLLNSMSDACLEQLRILVWQEAQALCLWSLEPAPATANLACDTLEYLQFAHVQILEEFTTRLSMAPGNAEPFNEYKVSFKLDQKSAHANLQRDGRITLNVTRNQFEKDWYAIYATKVKVIVNGIRHFTGTVTHPGRGTFQGADRSASPMTFSMIPRTSSADDQTPADLGAQEGQYVGLSPFTQWLLVFTTPVPDLLKHITSIDLAFSGTHRTWTPTI